MEKAIQEVTMNKNYEEIPLIKLSLYSTTITSVDNSIIYKDIIEFQQNNKESIKQKNSKLEGVYFASYEDSLFPKDSVECTKLAAAIKDSVCSILGVDMTMESIWALILKKNESVCVHSHKSNTHMFPKDYFSIAYYVKTPPGSARLFFETSYCNTIESVFPIYPKDGTLLIFNSFIKHFTERHQVDEERVVVSANFCPTQPNITPIPNWSSYQ